MKLINFTVIKLTLCLVAGILLDFFFEISWTYASIIASVLVLLFTISYFNAKKQFDKTIWFGIATLLTTISIGILVSNFHNEKNFSNHYTKFLDLEENASRVTTFRVREILKSGNYNDKYIIDILKIDNNSVSGKSLLNIKKDSFCSPLKVDHIFTTLKPFQNLTSPLNPSQFDYKAYLKKQYIYHQLYTSKHQLFRVSDNKHTFLGYANALRDYINIKLKKHDFKADELAIINALILGQRQNLNNDLRNTYINAGAVHILAVSGLHVGILLLILNFILKPITRLKHGRHLKLVLILFLLWNYVIIAGASASIIRAATMFSIVAFGMHLKRPSNIYNTLAISIFFILLFKPLFIFDVGFQMSYLAVIAIVAMQPLIYKLWKPQIWVIDKLWQVFSVTLAAQFGVVPISLFYFHQFPGLFWLSNLVVIPLLGVILSCGILVIILALVNGLPKLLADGFGFSISLMNNFFSWISKQEQFLFRDISFNILYVITSYLLIIALVRLYLNRNFKTLSFFLISFISLQIAFIYTKHEKSNRAFIVFHKSRHTLIGNQYKNKLHLTHNLDKATENKTLNAFIVANHITTLTEDTLQQVYSYKNKTFLLIDSLGIYNFKTIKPDYVVLRNSPRLNLNRLIDSLQPKGIIADGSNYKSYIARWETTCKKQKLPFHQTGKKGAFILN